MRRTFKSSCIAHFSVGMAAIAAAACASANPAPPTPSTATAAQTSTISLRFTVIETQTGSIMIALFDSEAAYAHDGRPARVLAIPVNAASVSASFAGLAPGDYAIKAFHDVDGNGAMAVNPFGMPTEPFAFSNNARGNMGPAQWSAAHFPVGTGSTVQTITLP